MRLAFCLYRYFPYGGLQRDFMKIALECQQRGHHIVVFTMDWQGPIPEGFEVRCLAAKGVTNAGRCRTFAAEIGRQLSDQRFDCVIGFNKIPRLDVYFAADPCFKARTIEERSLVCRLGRRYRIYSQLERAVFGPDSHASILMLTDLEKDRYIQYYQTAEERFHILPPGISRNRLVEKNSAELNAELRRELKLGTDEKLILMVGSGFRTKGLDRSLRALAALPADLRECVRLVVIGEGNERPFAKMARQIGVSDRVTFLGPRDDVPRFLIGADMLLHPSYTEAAGMVLLEAMTAGLPVLVTAVCGYAFHIARAEAGLLIPTPFRQEQMNRLLEQMLRSNKVLQWGRNGLAYVSKTDIYSLPQRAAEIIEQVSRKKVHA